jgi:hypothetical protein
VLLLPLLLQALAVELRVVGQDPASLLDKLNDAGGADGVGSALQPVGTLS